MLKQTKTTETKQTERVATIWFQLICEVKFSTVFEFENALSCSRAREIYNCVIFRPFSIRLRRFEHEKETN